MKNNFRFFIKTLFPSSWAEASVFFFFLIIYGLFGYYIAENYRLIYDERIPWDAYFSFDNHSIVNTGGGWERHPLAIYFFQQIRALALIPSGDTMSASFRCVLAFLSDLTISMGIVYIYKYLRNIIQIPISISILLTLFFGFFTTSIFLSFTPETYTYSFLLLVIFNYYSALQLQRNRNVGLPELTLFGIGIGGLTITNIVKVYIPLLFQKNLFKSWKIFGKTVLYTIVSIGIFVGLYLARLGLDYHRIFNQTSTQYEKFSKPKATPIWNMIVSWFWGGNMLSPSFIIRDYHSKENYYYKALFQDTYSSVFCYVFVVVIFIMVVWSYILNFKNKWVQILMLGFLVDIIIHCVMKFGLHTSYIYGGHFIYIVPWMMGWLFFPYKNNPRMLSFLTSVLGILAIYLVANNLFRIGEFIEFADKYYK